ncbi:hypothetical protein [Halioglobus sp. HI00S01]|nr:hypothetical protein [Halioglobus sp. HI00S01]
MSVKEDNVTEHFLFDGSTVSLGSLPYYGLLTHAWAWNRKAVTGRPLSGA